MPKDSQTLETLERGRYRITQLDDGDLLITRATETCDRCQSCGCGKQTEPMRIPEVIGRAIQGEDVNPAELMGLLFKLQGQLGGGLGGLLKGLMRR